MGTNLKMKLAEPETVTQAIVSAAKTWAWGDELHDEDLPGLVHEINVALTNAGCIIIQLDPAAA